MPAKNTPLLSEFVPVLPATTCEEIFALVPVPLCTASLSISTTRYAVEGLNT